MLLGNLFELVNVFWDEIQIWFAAKCVCPIGEMKIANCFPLKTNQFYEKSFI